MKSGAIPLWNYGAVLIIWMFYAILTKKDMLLNTPLLASSVLFSLLLIFTAVSFTYGRVYARYLQLLIACLFVLAGAYGIFVLATSFSPSPLPAPILFFLLIGMIFALAGSMILANLFSSKGKHEYRETTLLYAYHILPLRRRLSIELLVFLFLIGLLISYQFTTTVSLATAYSESCNKHAFDIFAVTEESRTGGLSNLEKCIIILAKEGLNYRLCVDMQGKISRDTCYEELAIEGIKEPFLCNKISSANTETRDHCYTQLAIITHNTTLCSKISTEDAQKGCFHLAAL